MTMSTATPFTGTPASSPPPEPPAPDAVCFTAGLKGAPFAAGVIHAYLAADRPAPRVAAGISMGALSAAALQRCYIELAGREEEDQLGTAERKSGADREVRRWSWYRRYLDALTDTPFDVLWRALPDPIDLFADRPPVQDLSCPPPLRGDEARARRKYFLLIKLGRWLAGLPVSVSSLARLAVSRVRQKERFGGSALSRGVGLVWAAGKVAFGMVWHLARSPQWVRERPFRHEQVATLRLVSRWIHPLFGWGPWLASVALGLGTGALALAGLLLLMRLAPLEGLPAAELAFRTALRGALPWWTLGVGGGLLVGSLLALGWFVSRKGSLFRYLEIERGLLSDYHLHRRLHELFAVEGGVDEPAIEAEPTRLLIVAAPLQPVGQSPGEPLVGQQLWAGRGARLIDALRAALAVPGVFPPIHLEGKEIDEWVNVAHGSPKPARLDLVDGSAVRSNPLPALCSYLALDKHHPIGCQLESVPGEPRVHLIYSVPIEPAARPQRSESLDIVEVMRLSLELAHRRDSQMECTEANFLSQVEHDLFGAREAGSRDGLLRLFVDEIAPAEDLGFGNVLAPSREEILTIAAAGCRRTLESLYRAQVEGHLEAMARAGASGQRLLRGAPCHHLLSRLAPRRLGWIEKESPGLAEVCRHCTRRLRASPPESAEHTPSYGLVDPRRSSGAEPVEGGRLVDDFPHLTGAAPRIVFLASGGVFRGATHIGVLAALCSADIRPDLIVGASVGALIGGALGAISVLEGPAAHRQLAELVGTFLAVDEKVSLTRTLKNAARQLGVRGQRIRLSPAQFSRMIRRGTRADVGYAAAGAPPALIDAISELTLLPSRQTRNIAAEFIAGHATEAARLFFSELQKETLRRLEIQYEVMGTSLLAQAARKLLGGEEGIDLGAAQPFHLDSCRVSFFCTASRLDTRQSFLLGRDFPPGCTHYDFLEAVLSSAAFPAVFSPRRESAVFPGRGRTDVLFSDGGMFDNLPFYPAIEVLEDVQASYRKSPACEPPLEFLEQRYRQPVLFIAAALDATRPTGTEGDCSHLLAIHHRAGQLKKNLKIRWYERVFELVGQQLRGFHKQPGPRSTGADSAFVDKIVHGGVLKIIPSDPDHLNPTFAFCASTGLSRERVQLAIADGCFQTFRALADAQEHATIALGQKPSFRDEEWKPTVVDHSIQALLDHKRLPELRREAPPGKLEPPECPFFTRWGKAFSCPFHLAANEQPKLSGVREVYQVCVRDPAHRREAPKRA